VGKMWTNREWHESFALYTDRAKILQTYTQGVNMDISTKQNRLALKRVLEIAQLVLEYESTVNMIKKELDFDDALMDRLHEIVSIDLLEEQGLTRSDAQAMYEAQMLNNKEN